MDKPTNGRVHSDEEHFGNNSTEDGALCKNGEKLLKWSQVSEATFPSFTLAIIVSLVDRFQPT